MADFREDVTIDVFNLAGQKALSCNAYGAGTAASSDRACPGARLVFHLR